MNLADAYRDCCRRRKVEPSHWLIQCLARESGTLDLSPQSLGEDLACARGLADVLPRASFVVDVRLARLSMRQVGAILGALPGSVKSIVVESCDLRAPQGGSALARGFFPPGGTLTELRVSSSLSPESFRRLLADAAPAASESASHLRWLKVLHLRGEGLSGDSLSDLAAAFAAPADRSLWLEDLWLDVPQDPGAPNALTTLLGALVRVDCHWLQDVRLSCASDACDDTVGAALSALLATQALRHLRIQEHSFSAACVASLLQVMQKRSLQSCTLTPSAAALRGHRTAPLREIREIRRATQDLPCAADLGGLGALLEEAGEGPAANNGAPSAGEAGERSPVASFSKGDALGESFRTPDDEKRVELLERHAASLGDRLSQLSGLGTGNTTKGAAKDSIADSVVPLSVAEDLIAASRVQIVKDLSAVLDEALRESEQRHAEALRTVVERLAALESRVSALESAEEAEEDAEGGEANGHAPVTAVAAMERLAEVEERLSRVESGAEEAYSLGDMLREEIVKDVGDVIGAMQMDKHVSHKKLEREVQRLAGTFERLESRVGNSWKVNTQTVDGISAMTIGALAPASPPPDASGSSTAGSAAYERSAFASSWDAAEG